MPSTFTRDSERKLQGIHVTYRGTSRVHMSFTMPSNALNDTAFRKTVHKKNLAPKSIILGRFCEDAR